MEPNEQISSENFLWSAKTHRWAATTYTLTAKSVLEWLQKKTAKVLVEPSTGQNWKSVKWLDSVTEFQIPTGIWKNSKILEIWWFLFGVFI